MNINKNTWHYKLFEFWHKYVPYSSDICSYLRGVVLGLFKVLLISIIAAFVIFGMINWIVLIPTGILLAIPVFPEIIAAVIVILGALAWAFLAYVAIAESYKYLKSKEVISKAFSDFFEPLKFNLPTIKKGSFLDVLKTRIKNKHDKLCTLVTFTVTKD